MTLSRRLVIIFFLQVKQPLGVGLFFNVYAIFWGFFDIIRYPKMSMYLGVFLYFVGVSTFLHVLNWDLENILRTGQLLGLIFFCNYLVRLDISVSNLHLMLFLLLTSSFFIIEFCFAVRYSREILGVGIPRLAGLHGEPNYNGILILSILFALIQRSKTYPSRVLVVLTCLVGALGMSRGLLVGVIIFSVCYLFSKVFIGRVLNLFILCCFLLFPYVVHIAGENLDASQILSLNLLSSGRIALWFGYLNIAFDNWFGLGYFGSQQAISEYLDVDFFTQVRPQQAHSWQFQVLAEFGIVGYLVLCLGLLVVARKLKRKRFGFGVLMFTVSSFSILNVFGEISFWILVSVVVRELRVSAGSQSHPVR